MCVCGCCIVQLWEDLLASDLGTEHCLKMASLTPHSIKQNKRGKVQAGKPWSRNVGFGTFWVGRERHKVQLQFQGTRGGLGWALEEVTRSGREFAGAGNLGDLSLGLECVSHLCSKLRPNSAFQAGNQY